MWSLAPPVSRDYARLQFGGGVAGKGVGEGDGEEECHSPEDTTGQPELGVRIMSIVQLFELPHPLLAFLDIGHDFLRGRHRWFTERLSLIVHKRGCLCHTLL